MKILIVTNHFYPETFRINEIAFKLVEKGHQVSVLTGTPDYPCKDQFSEYGLFNNSYEIIKGVKIYRFPRLSRGNGSKFRLFINYLSFAIFSCLLAPFKIKERFDKIFVFETSPITVALPAILLKNIRSVPVYLWIQDLWPESAKEAGGLKNPIVLGALNLLVKSIYKHSDQILVQSKGFIKLITNMGVGHEKVIYFPNPAEKLFDNVFQIDTQSCDHILPEGFRIIFAGNLGEAQDFPTILSAAEYTKHIEKIKWILIGDGSRRKWIEQQISQKGLSQTVFLIERQPLEAMPKFFASADVLLVTLKKAKIFSLTVPSKVQSYMASRRPILGALDGEGRRLITESGSGFCVSSGDYSSLAKQAINMAEMKIRELSDMGYKGRKYYEENFEEDKLISKLESIMQTTA